MTSKANLPTGPGVVPVVVEPAPKLLTYEIGVLVNGWNLELGTQVQSTHTCSGWLKAFGKDKIVIKNESVSY